MLIETIEELMNHRPPMRWVDEILEMPRLGSGITRTLVRPGTLMLKDDLVYPSVYIELLGQSYGYIRALEHKGGPLVLKNTYLASIDEFEMLEHSPIRPGASLITEVHTDREVPPLYFVSGQITCEGRLICRARLKCYAEFENRKERV